MQPIDAYLMYCAMKAHFDKSDYDFVKYNGKSKVSRDSFYKRNDRIFFVKLTKKYKSDEYMLSGTTFSNGVLNRLNFDGGASNIPFEGKVKALAVYKEALTDAELQCLTTI